MVLLEVVKMDIISDPHIGEYSIMKLVGLIDNVLKFHSNVIKAVRL